MLPVRPLVELHIAKQSFDCLAIISKRLTLLFRLLRTFFSVVRACFFMFNSASKGLHPIVLFPVDCNFAFKDIGRSMMRVAEKTKSIACEQYNMEAEGNTE